MQPAILDEAEDTGTPSISLRFCAKGVQNLACPENGTIFGIASVKVSTRSATTCGCRGRPAAVHLLCFWLDSVRAADHNAFQACFRGVTQDVVPSAKFEEVWELYYPCPAPVIQI